MSHQWGFKEVSSLAPSSETLKVELPLPPDDIAIGDVELVTAVGTLHRTPPVAMVWRSFSVSGSMSRSSLPMSFSHHLV